MRDSIKANIATACLQVLVLIALVSCATSPKEKFDTITLGMDKSMVIDNVGSPDKTQRSDSKDIWTYRYQTNDNVIDHEIVFKEGFVIYTGEPQTAAIQKSKTEEEAAFILKNKLSNEPKEEHDFKDVNEDGTF